MSRRFILLDAAFATLLVVATSHAQTSATPEFGQGIDLVGVDVLVFDARGQPVTDLRREDFAVSDNGIAQEITSFEAVNVAESQATTALPDALVSTNVGVPMRPERSVVVIVDDVHLTAIGMRRAWGELRKLIEGLRPGDELSLVPTSESTWWSGRLPEGRDDLLAFLERLQPKEVADLSAGRLSEWEAMQIHFGRDPQVLSVVARRWYENGLLVEFSAPRGDPQAAQERGISPGLPLIRAKATQMYQAAGERLTRSLSVVERAVASLSLARGRKSVLVVSEGFVYDNTRPEFRELIRTARQANAALYFFDARGQAGIGGLGNDADLGNATEERDRITLIQNFSHDAEGTESVALDTGGLAVKGTDDLAGPMLRVVDESRSYYLLGFLPADTKRDGRFHSLKVQVARPGVTLRARKGYYAADDKAEKKKRVLPDSELDPRVRDGLVSPFVAAGIPLRLASFIVDGGASGTTLVMLAAELDLGPVRFTPKAGRQIGALETYVVVTPRAGGENVRQEKRMDLALPADVHARLVREGLPLLRNFDLKPGVYQARLLVRDEQGGALGTVRHTFTVPEPEGLRLSTPILTDSVAGEGDAQRPLPIARRRFPAGTRLVYAFDVFGAKPGAPVTLAYAVRRKDGTALAQPAPRPVPASADGSVAQRIDLPLTGVAPGEYEIVLSVDDPGSGQKLERHDPFVVE
jgi:VWFA-related protein